jgi:hypothetical protein
MADDAGFAVALTLRERLLNDGVLIAYAGGGFPHSLATDLPDDPPPAHIEMFLAPPQVTCRADNTLSLTVRMWGQLKVTMNGVEETGNVSARLTLRLRPTFVVGTSKLTLGFDDVNTDVIATAWSFTVISGPGFSPAADGYLRSTAFRNRLQKAIQIAIAFRVVKLPDIDISFVGAVLDAVAGATAASRVVDGALLLGIDVESEDITTAGDPGQLADFARDNDVAAVTNAVAVPLLLEEVRTKVHDKVAEEGATLERLTMQSKLGKFHVEGRASKSTGTADFSFDLIPAQVASRPGKYFQYLDRPVHVNPRTWPALRFATANVDVDVDPSTWVVIVTALGAILNFGIPLIVADMISDISSRLDASISSADPGSGVPRVQYREPSKPGGARVRIAIEDYEISQAGTYIGLTVQPKAPPGAAVGLTSIPSDLRTHTLGYTVRLPLGVVLDDPALRIRWTVSDPSGTVLVNEDDVAAGRETFTFVPQAVAPGLSTLAVACRVYRALGAEITDFVNDGVALEIRGPLPAGAYVRWYYDVKNPQVRYDAQAEDWAYAGELVVKRHSNIHRTDQPCANASKQSRYGYRTDVFDTLPMPVVDIVKRRSELCDYCFFGGPGGIRPAL